MNRPTRWLEDPLLDSDVRALLAAGEAPQALPSEARRQTEHRLSVWLSLGPVAASIWGLKHAPGNSITNGIRWGEWLARRGSTSLSMVALCTLGVAGALVAAYATPATDSAQHVNAETRVVSAPLPVQMPASALLPAPAAEAQRAEAITVTTERGGVKPVTQLKQPSKGAGRDTARALHAKSNAASVDELMAEAAELRRIRALKNPASKLVELEQHTTHFPHGQLRSERQLLQSQVLAQLGSNVESCSLLRELARRQLKQEPYSRLASERLKLCNPQAGD